MLNKVDNSTLTLNSLHSLREFLPDEVILSYEKTYFRKCKYSLKSGLVMNENLSKKIEYLVLVVTHLSMSCLGFDALW